MGVIRNEGVLKLYSGLSPVVTFIGPKMATKFASFEYYKKLLAGTDGRVSGGNVFIGEYGGAIVHERLLTSLSCIGCGPLQKEGPSALYKGILPRVLRVGPGQAVAYAAYEKIATFLRE